MSCVDLQTQVSQLWKALAPEDKKKYQDQANEEKLHYMLKLKKFYENATPEALEEATKPKPKRPYSAYCYFVKEVRQVIKLPDAKFKMQDILKQASEKWRMLSEEEKSVYQERAKQAKEAYLSEAPEFNETVEPIRLGKLSESALLFEKAKEQKKIQEKEAEASLNKKRGVFFSKDIQEKMDKLNNENSFKKVKLDSQRGVPAKIEALSSPETAQSVSTKYGKYFGTPLSCDDNEALRMEMKQENGEDSLRMFQQIPVQLQPEHYWPNYALRQQAEFFGYNMPQPQFWNMNMSHPNIMNLMMGYEQVRKYMIHQMMMNQMSDTASQDSFSTLDAKIEVKTENF